VNVAADNQFHWPGKPTRNAIGLRDNLLGLLIIIKTKLSVFILRGNEKIIQKAKWASKIPNGRETRRNRQPVGNEPKENIRQLAIVNCAESQRKIGIIVTDIHSTIKDLTFNFYVENAI